jgi:hypothetical protein
MKSRKTLLLALIFCVLTFTACPEIKTRPCPTAPTPAPSPVASPSQTATPTPEPLPSPSPSPVPSPAGELRFTSLFSGDLSTRINAADLSIGSGAGTIFVDTTGDITAQLTLSDNHTLQLPAGYLDLPSLGRDVANIVIGDNSAIFGAGRDLTVLLEPENGYKVIQSFGSTQSQNTFSDAGVTSNIQLAGFTVQGRNTVAEGGVRSTINLGNAHHVRIRDLGLRDTTCLGITAGGTALSGNHAEDWIVEDILLEGVASQSLNVVNGSDITWRRITVRRAGKLCTGSLPGQLIPCEGACPLDIEPNTPLDRIRDVVIEDINIDSSGSPFLHGNGICIQNTVHVPDFGPVTLRRFRIAGGPLIDNFSGNLATGVFVAGAARNTTITDGEIIRVGHSGVRLEGGSGVVLRNLKLVSTGAGGIQALELINQTDSQLFNISITVDPRSPLGTATIVESGSSDRNTFQGITASGGIILVGPASSIKP